MPSLYMGGNGSWVETARDRFLDEIPQVEIMQSRGDLPLSLDADLLTMATVAMFGVSVGRSGVLRILTLATDAMRIGKPFVIWVGAEAVETIPEMIRHSHRVHILGDLEEAIETTVQVVRAFS